MSLGSTASQAGIATSESTGSNPVPGIFDPHGAGDVGPPGGAGEHTSFNVVYNGQIESARIPGYTRVFVRYSLAHGSDWTLLRGTESGLTQTCSSARQPSSLSAGASAYHLVLRGYSGGGGPDAGSGGGRSHQAGSRAGVALDGHQGGAAVAADDVFVVNFPLDLSFRSTNPHGWPQLLVQVYGYDRANREVIVGYGMTHLPTNAGMHVRYIRLFRPVSSSLLQQFRAWLTGVRPEYTDVRFVAQGDGREGTFIDVVWSSYWLQCRSSMVYVVKKVSNMVWLWGYLWFVWGCSHADHVCWCREDCLASRDEEYGSLWLSVREGL